jgi:hypothetical protein
MNLTPKKNRFREPEFYFLWAGDLSGNVRRRA